MFWQDITEITYWEGGPGLRQGNVGCLLGVWKNILKCGSSVNICVWRVRSTVVRFRASEGSPPQKPE